MDFLRLTFRISPRPTCMERRQLGVVLELVEGLLQHVLRVDLRHAQQVQHHVVGESELRVDPRGSALNDHSVLWT